MARGTGLRSSKVLGHVDGRRGHEIAVMGWTGRVVLHKNAPFHRPISSCDRKRFQKNRAPKNASTQVIRATCNWAVGNEQGWFAADDGLHRARVTVLHRVRGAQHCIVCARYSTASCARGTVLHSTVPGVGTPGGQQAHVPGRHAPPMRACAP